MDPEYLEPMKRPARGRGARSATRSLRGERAHGRATDPAGGREVSREEPVAQSRKRGFAFTTSGPVNTSGGEEGPEVKRDRR